MSNIPADLRFAASHEWARLEAGMTLYGQDIDEAHSPLTSNLAHNIALEPADRDFIGSRAKEAEPAACVQLKLISLVLAE